ncbi:MAG: 5-formyltetrahydrofolate cyclo-ligase [Bacteroidales bacterium]|nr:5-formyltetrahydrofolate cyclo-ligase [Bacteroidales bacterium]
MDKAAVRKYVKEQKQALCREQMSAEAALTFAAIEALPCFQQARNVLMYYSLPDELPTHAFVKQWALQKRIFLPRVKGDDLEIAEYGALEREPRFGIEEPVAPAVDPALIDLVIVPAVALDAQGNRVGRGKGYYDRLLPQCRNAVKIGVCFQCQMLEHLPTEAHDAPLDAVVTALNTIFIKPQG